MGLKPIEVKSLCLRDFNLMLTGYFKRQERELNQTRHIMAYIKTYSGLGATEAQYPQDIWPLSIDKEDAVKRISSIAEAMELLKEFLTL